MYVVAYTEADDHMVRLLFIIVEFNLTSNLHMRIRNATTVHMFIVSRNDMTSIGGVEAIINRYYLYSL